MNDAFAYSLKIWLYSALSTPFIFSWYYFLDTGKLMYNPAVPLLELWLLMTFIGLVLSIPAWVVLILASSLVF
jgi:hypothetical protein